MKHASGVRAYDPSHISGLPLDVVASSRGVADVCALAQLQPGQRVLDLGCGGGLDCLIAARMVGQATLVAGIDADAASIALAQDNAGTMGMPDIAFRVGRLEQLPFDDATFDVLLSNCVFNLCEDKAAVFAEAARVLKPGGRLVTADVVELRPVDMPVRRCVCELLGCDVQLQDVASFAQALRDAGFAHVDSQVLTAYTADDLQARAKKLGACDALGGIDLADADASTGVVVIVAGR